MVGQGRGKGNGLGRGDVAIGGSSKYNLNLIKYIILLQPTEVKSLSDRGLADSAGSDSFSLVRLGWHSCQKSTY